VEPKKDLLCLIPARGGSKRLPRKNILQFNGAPLISYSIKCALECALFDKVFVSTEDDETASIAKDFGAQVIDRPIELAGDTIRLVDICLSAIEGFEKMGVHYQDLCLLLPTVVLRTAEDILATYTLFKENEANYAVSVTEVPNEFNPYWTFTAKGAYLSTFVKGGLDKKRQEIDRFFIANQGVNFAKVSRIKVEKTILGSKCCYYVLPRERAIDIDTQFDFDLAEYLYQKNLLLHR
jgi:CMP-N,N'-diacetyllegionaminic acid synthase